jgi:hypothetical protein
MMSEIWKNLPDDIAYEIIHIHEKNKPPYLKCIENHTWMYDKCIKASEEFCKKYNYNDLDLGYIGLQYEWNCPQDVSLYEHWCTMSDRNKFSYYYGFTGPGWTVDRIEQIRKYGYRYVEDWDP